MFTLHPQLEKDTVLIAEFDLCLCLLTKDANYPWCILVPQRADITEIHQLDAVDRQQLLDESCRLSVVMEGVFRPHKMNVAALGNMVPQLHLHHIARFRDDAAWPKPVWGVADAVEYDTEQLEQRLEALRVQL